MTEDQQIKERLANRDKKFLTWWEKKRQNKWGFILIQGAVFWCLTVGTISYLLITRFDFQAFDWEYFLIHTMVFSVGGVAWQFWTYRTQEKRYLKLTE